MGYTWAQFRGYLVRGRKRQAEQRLTEFLAQTVAAAGGKPAKDYLDAAKRDIAAAEDEED